MSEAEPNAEVQRWLRYAQEDLIVSDCLEIWIFDLDKFSYW